MTFSKSEVDKLGDKIRLNAKNISFDTILELQQYRTLHQVPLSNIFNILCSLTHNKKGSTIATYRLKRFESIINKLERFPKMRFNRMWDIAGCRIIVEREEEVSYIVEKIIGDKRLNVRKINDYIKEKNDDGYKSVHIYAELVDSNLPIEIQIRTNEQHNWATLVEITDLIYKTRLKEIGKKDNEDLYKFHQYLSDKKNLTYKKCEFIYKTFRKYNFLERLNEIFSKNYINVRKQWYKLEQNNSQKYYLIEVDKNNITKLQSFNKFIEAEEAYFNLYNSTNDSNAVLTYQQKYDFKLLTTAYANYILTYHSFLKEALEILERLIYESLNLKKYYFAYKLYDYYNNLVNNFMQISISEIEEAIKIYLPATNNKLSKKRQHDWLKDISKQLRYINSNLTSLNRNMSKIRISNPFYDYLYVKAISITNKKYINKLKRTFKNSEIFKDALDSLSNPPAKTPYNSPKT